MTTRTTTNANNITAAQRLTAARLVTASKQAADEEKRKLAEAAKKLKEEAERGKTFHVEVTNQGGYIYMHIKDGNGQEAATFTCSSHKLEGQCGMSYLFDIGFNRRRCYNPDCEPQMFAALNKAFRRSMRHDLPNQGDFPAGYYYNRAKVGKLVASLADHQGVALHVLLGCGWSLIGSPAYNPNSNNSVQMLELNTSREARELTPRSVV